MKFAVIRTGGKQYKVSEGQVVDIERIAIPMNEVVTFSDVLFVSDGDVMTVGMPLITGFSVSGTVLEHPRGEKIRVSKFKAKARFRRVTGHRQALSRVRIDAIGTKSKSSKASDSESVKEETPVVKKKSTPRVKKVV